MEQVQQGSGQTKITAPELENGLGRKQMHGVAKSIGAPDETILDNRVPFPPVLLAISFPEGEGRDQRILLRS